jgi:tripartite-type tricarboxylate transporter receptor subunit TctC
MVLALILVGAATPAKADYPEKPVRIILPYGPGGVADVTTRLVAQKLGERLGKQFVVDNRPGAGGIVAATAVTSSPPDGYTLFLSGNGAAISVSLFKSLPYDILRDFASISLMAKFDMLLATNAESNIDSVAKLVAFARANPGKLNFGTIAPGSTQHLSAELFNILAGTKATVVTYRSSPELVTALLRGDVQIGFDYLAAFRAPLTDKKIKVIATSGEHPSKQLPGVPTVKDSGYPDYVFSAWNALAAPAGVPRDIIAKLNREVNEVLKDPEVQARASQFGMEAAGSTPEELTALMKSDAQKWGQVIEKIGLPKQ